MKSSVFASSSWFFALFSFIRLRIRIQYSHEVFIGMTSNMYWCSTTQEILYNLSPITSSVNPILWRMLCSFSIHGFSFLFYGSVKSYLDIIAASYSFMFFIPPHCYFSQHETSSMICFLFLLIAIFLSSWFENSKF